MPASRTNPDVYIYGLVDPKTNAVRYVGRSRSPMSRFSAHLSKRNLSYTHPSNRKLYEWVAALAADGMRPMLLLIEKRPLMNAPDGEQKWIDHFRATGEIFNTTASRTRLVPVTRFTKDIRFK